MLERYVINGSEVSKGEFLATCDAEQVQAELVSFNELNVYYNRGGKV